MQRRDFFKTAVFLYLTKQNLFASESTLQSIFSNLFDFDKESEKNDDNLKQSDSKPLVKEEQRVFSEDKIVQDEEEYEVIEHFDVKDAVVEDENRLLHRQEDIYVEDKFTNAFLSLRDKLTLVQRYMGYGNFNILSFDEALRIGQRISNITPFTKEEIEFWESIFYYDPKIHGFYGDKISQNITDRINKREVKKIPHTGHYLFKGHSEETYYKMVDDIGDSMILTSGVRSIVKQTKLFLDKLYSVDGNFTVAAKSLAPPAFTYHTVGDFDVGKRGFGEANFTARFALTEEFFAMRKLKYIDMRYTINNKDGVRYEPWHVKVI